MKKCKNEFCNNVAQQGGVCCLHGAISRAHAKQCRADGCTNTSQKKGLCRHHANKTTRNTVAVGATPPFDGEHQKKIDGRDMELLVAQNYIAVQKQQLQDKNQQMINCSEQLETAKPEVEGYKKEFQLKDSSLEQTQTTMTNLRSLLESRDHDFVAQTDKDKQQIQQLSNQLQSAQQGIKTLPAEVNKQLQGANNHIAQVLPIADNEPIQQSESEVQMELTQIKSNINELKSEILEMKSEMKIELNAFKASVQSDMTEIKLEMKDELNAFKASVQSDMTEIRSEMVALKSEMKVELHTFKASIQSDMTEIKSMLRQFGAI